MAAPIDSPVSRAVLSALGVLCVCAAARGDDAEPASAEEAVVALYESGRLFEKDAHDYALAAFTLLFERRQAAAVEAGFGSAHAELTAWLGRRPAVKRKLYTAIDPSRDKVPVALSLFRQLWEGFPAEVEAFPDLAVAVAVTWDDPRAVYDYAGHQRRTKSEMPGGQLDAVGNFRYAVEHRDKFEGRVESLPWEFLSFVVDHRTPLPERLWAQAFYEKGRGLKSWHQSVPYDHDMLKGERTGEPGLVPKLKGKEYTLANLLQCGGVCTNQADFAVRVAKSVGIPAAYCGGKSAYRGGHAWWMFVQTAKGRGGKLDIALKSDGRFEGFLKDQFYTGTLKDPASGERILDRDMERRLALTGSDLRAKRQADLVMRAYPWLAEKFHFGLPQRVEYLDRTLKLCPFNEAAWDELARLAREGELTPAHAKGVVARLALMFKTFQGYPDFISGRLDDLLSVAGDPRSKVDYYDYVARLYERAGRPDLACDARLRAAELLIGQKDFKAAARGLTQTVRKFPTEGRYVPALTLKLQEISGNYKDGDTELARLYLDLVPAMIAYYRKGDAGYSGKIYRQAMDYLNGRKLDTYATRLETAARALGFTPGG